MTKESYFEEVRVRFPPSPTGAPHVGTAYSALLNFAFAKSRGGKIVLRIEDTDRARSTKESEEAILNSLHWLGLQWDEGPDIGGPYAPYRQSERSEIYKRHAQQLLENDAAYCCFCTQERLNAMRKEQQAKKLPPRYDGLCRRLSPKEVKERKAKGETYVIRLKVPTSGETVFHDIVRGDIKFKTAQMDDQVLIKSDGFPTYHLANVVDDHLMKISHVIRGEEWISSTPKHVLLYQAFGWEMPTFAHFPLLRAKGGRKISKRKDPTSLLWYREQGYLPEALRNFLALMGWSTSDGEEVFDIERMIKEFSLEGIKTGGPIFDLQKLDWLNGVYIRNLTIDELIGRLRNEGFVNEDVSNELLKKIVPLIQERIKKLSEFKEMTDFFFVDELNYDAALLVQKKRQKDETKTIIDAARSELNRLSDWTIAEMERCMRTFCEKSGWKTRELFMTLRVAVTGRTASPPLFETMEVLGKDVTLRRLDKAISLLS